LSMQVVQKRWRHWRDTGRSEDVDAARELTIATPLVARPGRSSDLHDGIGLVQDAEADGAPEFVVQRPHGNGHFLLVVARQDRRSVHLKEVESYTGSARNRMSVARRGVSTVVLRAASGPRSTA